MVLFPGHLECSLSAVRERCAEVRDVFVDPPSHRRGVGRAIMLALEQKVGTGELRVGLSVSIDEQAAPAREMYESLGYRRAHGPFLASTMLEGDEGPFAVGATLVYVVKDA